jgi:hypothetical protein
MFECDACGHCCRNLDKSSIYSELDRGDGTCKYLVGDLCSIYENRPLICRVDESYEKFFKDIMSLEEYYKLNCEACIRLKEEAKKNKY